MADQEDAQLNHPTLKDAEFVNNGLLPNYHGGHYDDKSNNHSRRPQSPIKLVIDNSDINNITALNQALNDDDEYEKAVSAYGSDDEEEDDGNVEPCDVQRHFWTRNGDIKYWYVIAYWSSLHNLTTIQHRVHHKGVRHYLTAEELEDRFNGVKSALWEYWHKKRAGQISLDKLMEHLRRMGHQGFFREMLWHLLPPRLQRMLNKLRKEGKLDTFFL